MHDSSLDLFCDSAARETERRAAELEITVDYYIEEFLDFDMDFPYDDLSH